MCADKMFEITTNLLKIYLPKLSAQAQKFGISMKKGFVVSALRYPKLGNQRLVHSAFLHT